MVGREQIICRRIIHKHQVSKITQSLDLEDFYIVRINHLINSPISVRSEGLLRAHFLLMQSTEWHHATWHGQSLILTIHWLFCLDRIVSLTRLPLHLVELYQIFDVNVLVSYIHVTFDNPQFYERGNVPINFFYQLTIWKNLGEVLSFWDSSGKWYFLNWFQILTK